MLEFNRWRDSQIALLQEHDSQITVLDAWESELKRHEQEFLALQSARQNLLSQYVRKVEHYHLLVIAQQIMGTESKLHHINCHFSAFMPLLMLFPLLFPLSLRDRTASTIASNMTDQTQVPSSKSSTQSGALLASHQGDGALDFSQSTTLRFEHISGIMKKRDQHDFVQLLRRVSRGNCFVQVCSSHSSMMRTYYCWFGVNFFVVVVMLLL